MRNNLKNKFNSWRRNRKITRETPEIWLLESMNMGYIQIPKVATRSIQECLANCYVDCKSIEEPLVWTKSNIRDVERLTAFHATQKYISKIAENNYIFAFVRNPYDRLYSAYKNKVLQPSGTGGKNFFWNHGIRFGMKFDEFVDVVCEIPDRKIDRHLRSQSWFLTYEDKLIPDFIGKLEEFEKDWGVLNERFELGYPTHKNSTKSLNVDDYPAQYSKRLEEKVFNRYRKDFEYFSYVRMQVNTPG
jgi:hypothetical protein